MPTKVAFLRGINVGGNTLLKMTDLRDDMAEMGLENIKTVLASGNAIFDSKKLDQSLATALSKKLVARLGREISVIIRPLEEIESLEHTAIFKKANISKNTRLYVSFIAPEMQDIEFALPPPSDAFLIERISPGVICSVLRDVTQHSTLDIMEVIEKMFAKKVTTRNWNTIQKILQAAR